MPGALDLEPLTNLMLAVVAEKDIDVGIRVSQALFFFLSSDRIREYPINNYLWPTRPFFFSYPLS